MKWLSMVCLLVVFAALGFMVSCTAEQVSKTADEVASVARAAQPLLPPPFGLIASAVIGVAGVVGSLAAGKAKGTAIAAGKDPHPIADFISTHVWIYPSLLAAASFARAKGWIHLSDDEITALFGALGAASVTNVVADKKAEDKAPEAPAAPQA